MCILENCDVCDTLFNRETHRISHSNVPGVLEVCLELLSNLKTQFGFVDDEFSEFAQSRKSLFSRHF